MSQEIQFKHNQSRRYVATKSFTLGANGTQIVEGSQLDYDGTVADYNGARVNSSQLRGAIRVGWLVPAEKYIEGMTPAPPPSAKIQIRKAEGGNPLKPQEKMSVATVNTEDQEVRAGFVYKANRTGSKDSDEGRTVKRTFKTKATTVTELSSDGAVGEALRATAVTVQAGKGITVDEALAQMSPEQRDEFEAHRAASRAQRNIPEQSNVVARIKSREGKLEKEGMTITTSVGNGTAGSGDYDDGVVVASINTDEKTVIESEGIRFTTTNGPKRDRPKAAAKAAPVAGGGTGDVARTIAKAICPDFPDSYDFSASPRKKIARLQADFEDRPDVIRAVAAADTDPALRARLVEEFPGAFTQ